jgi:hypothetical protein
VSELGVDGLHPTLLLAQYIAAAAVGLVVVVLWKKGPNYWPAGRLLALAACVPWIYRGYRRAQLWGRPEEEVLRTVNNPAHLVWVYGFVLILLAWVVALQVRTNRVPASRSVSLSGRAELEDRDTAIFHLRAAARLRKHGVLDAGDWERVVREELGWVDRLAAELAERRAQRERATGGG